MKKNKLITTLCCISILGTLSSCLYFNFSDDSSTDRGSNNAGHYSTPTYGANDSADNITLKNIGLSFGQRYLPSTGNSKILVVPIQLTDRSFTSVELSRLDKTFFGTKAETGWESLASYYEESSGGQLHISGEVSEVVNMGISSTQLETNDKNYGKSGSYTDVILDSALSALNKSGMDLSSYDTDSDGYIDAVWMVYSVKYNSNSNALWAYTTWSGKTTSFGGKKACLYSWASIDFLTDGGYWPTSSDTNGDAHTIVHETGHMLGLDDYYSYDYDRSTNFDTPLGGLDMMDFNIGDHNAYSKYLLGWYKPTIITEEYLTANNNVINLTSFADTGKSLLIPCYKDGASVYNGTPFDEYLLVQYYTPTGVNQVDATVAYENGAKMFSKPGVMVLHVNASIGKLTTGRDNSINWDNCLYDKLPAYNSSTWGVYFAYWYVYSNTRSYSYDQSFAELNYDFYKGTLLSLLPSTGKKIQGSKTNYASNSSLYMKGDAFHSKDPYDFTFDDWSVPQYGFEVKNTSSSNCELTFSAF